MLAKLTNPKFLRGILPAVSLAILLGAIFYLQPRAMSYFGLNLMLQYAVPIALATIAQMFIITVNDLDLSIGPFVGLVACIGATYLHDTPVLGIFALLLAIAAYGALGALIHWRNLPSIVVTLGMSFVWLGVAILILPTPGGTAPSYLKAMMSLKIPLVPFPIVAAVVIALVVHFGLMRSSYGAVLRGAENQDHYVFNGRTIRRFLGVIIDWPDHICRRPHCRSLHAVCNRGRDSGRWRICRRASIPDRRSPRRIDPCAIRLVPDFPSYINGLASWRTRWHPDYRPCTARTH